MNHPDNAVSPVIGVIVMIIIIVTLAAFVASMVFSSGSNGQHVKVTDRLVAVSVFQKGNDVTFTYLGGSGKQFLSGLRIITATGIITWEPISPDTLLNPGEKKVITVAESQKIQVIAYFVDGSETTIFNDYPNPS